MHTEYFVLASFHFVVGIGVFWSIFLISDTMKFTQGTENVHWVSKFYNRININLGEFHEANVFNIMNSAVPE